MGYRRSFGFKEYGKEREMEINRNDDLGCEAFQFGEQHLQDFWSPSSSFCLNTYMCFL